MTQKTLAILAGLAIVIASGLLVFALVEPTYQLRMTAGDALGRRHKIAEALNTEAQPLGVTLDIIPTRGSNDALDRLEAGELDVALIQGGLPPREGIREVAPLVVEPLHLLVRPQLAGPDLRNLRGKMINTSTAGSGTRTLALAVLEFAGLESGTDYFEFTRSYEELVDLAPAEMPDALFVVSLLPSSFIRGLVERHGYVLQPLPFADAMALDNLTIAEAIIPACTYSAVPPVPPEDLPTLGTRLMLVARQDVPESAVLKLLEALYAGHFARATNLGALSPDLLNSLPEYPWHDGTLSFVQRREPLITAESIEDLENIRSFLVSLAVAGFLLWQWLKRRRLSGFERYLDRVTQLEKEALALEQRPVLELNRLLQLRMQVTALKSEALDAFASGRLTGEELMSTFVMHVNDVRTYLNSMILHERERLEERALTERLDVPQELKLQQLWSQALGETADFGPVPPVGQSSHNRL